MKFLERNADFQQTFFIQSVFRHFFINNMYKVVHLYICLIAFSIFCCRRKLATNFCTLQKHEFCISEYYLFSPLVVLYFFEDLFLTKLNFVIFFIIYYYYYYFVLLSLSLKIVGSAELFHSSISKVL